MKKLIKILKSFLGLFIHPQGWIEKNSRKQANVFFAWLVALLAIIVILIIILSFFIKIGMMVIIAGIVIFIAASLKTYYDGRVMVMENHVALLETFGSYSGKDDYASSIGDDPMLGDDSVLKSGMNFIFPYFSIYKVHDNLMYFIGRTQEKIFKNEKDSVDFKDVSGIFIESSIVYQIIDARKAAYNADDYLQIIIDKSEEAVMTVMRPLGFEEAKEKIKNFNVFYIFSTEKERTENENDPDFVPKTVIDIEINYGVRIVDFFITDIKETAEQEKARVDNMKMQIELSRVELEKQIALKRTEVKFIEADTQAGVIEKIAKANVVECISLLEAYKQLGLNSDQITALKTAELLKDNSKLILGGNNSGGTFGAEMGFGVDFVNSKKNEVKTESSLNPKKKK